MNPPSKKRSRITRDPPVLASIIDLQVAAVNLKILPAICCVRNITSKCFTYLPQTHKRFRGLLFYNHKVRMP